jgi:translation initiation factor IF-3
LLGRCRIAKDLKLNREIKSATVRVINEEGQPLGVISLDEAIANAERVGLDLVEVSSNTDPPVCKIMDYGKYRYKQSKKIHDARKSQTVIHVKEIRLRPKTEAHDLQTKIKHIKKFLEQHDKVKVSMMFRGREIAFTEIGRKLMDQIKIALADECIMDQEPRLEGRNMVMIVSPKK